MAVREIVRIDEDLCDGCGECVPSCAEGAIQIIDGKAKLIRDDFCDGLGACLGDCPTGALSIEKREATEFDEEAVQEHLDKGQEEPEVKKPIFRRIAAGSPPPSFGCPSARLQDFGRPEPAAPRAPRESAASALAHWPIKLKLVPPAAPFLRDADLMLAADCVPFAYPSLHNDLLPDHAVVIGCPKFDEYGETLARLTEILRHSGVRSFTVVTMEVPCCFGYWHMAQEAVAASGCDIPLKQVIIGVRGELKEIREAGAPSSPFAPQPAPFARPNE